MSAATSDSTPATSEGRRARWAGLLVAVGLLVQALTLVWNHPTSFVLFLVVGAVLVAAGVVTYLADRAFRAG